MRTAPFTIVSLLAIGTYGCICLESCQAPERFPQSSGVTALEGPRPALLYHMYSSSGTVFAALILQPVGSVVGWNRSSFSVECARASETLGWNYSKGQAEVVMSYSVTNKTLRVAEQTFTTGSGNTFLVTLDDAWSANAQALGLAAGGSPQDTLARIQKALPQDREISALRPVHY